MLQTGTEGKYDIKPQTLAEKDVVLDRLRSQFKLNVDLIVYRLHTPDTVLVLYIKH